MSSSIGTRRQLPPWMLRVKANDHVSNSVSEVVNKEDGLEEVPTAATCQSESTKTDSHLLKKCKTTRSRRKLVKRAEPEDDVSTIHEGDLEKENYAPPPRKRKAKVLKATRNISIEESTLSEDELSVDDLISIAKEYINSEKTQEGQRSSLAECESASLLRSTSSEDNTTHRDNIQSSNSISNLNTLESSSSDLVEYQPSERGVTSFGKSGDFAQEMLELFLGPIVKRSAEVKPNFEPVNKSVALNYVSSSQTRDAVPLVMKKKGSLKDKVAMLLS